MTGKAQEEFAPERAHAALLLVDVLNGLDFEGGELLLQPALTMADAICELKAACAAAGIPAIYVNDNFGRWQSSLDQLIERDLEDEVRGAALIRRLLPAPRDYRILKPEHSAFFASPLDLLLRRLGVRNLILTGLTTDRCIAFTASDAHMRGYTLFIPRDGCAAMTREHHDASLTLLERVVQANTSPWRDLNLASLNSLR